jgi:ABC-type multidrug transport system fused ATPase/permease subunit
MYVEDNSAAIFLQRSVKNYVSFTVQMLMAINLTVIAVASLMIGEITIYSYLLSMILYFLIMQSVNDALMAYLDFLMIDCKQNMLNSEIKAITNNTQVSLLYESMQIGNGEGLSIEFNDVQVKLCGKKMLDIQRMRIEKFDVIGLTGNSSHLMTAVMFKLLKPVIGSITIEGHDLSVISQENLSKMISVVPHDLKIQNVTIS